MLAQLGRWDIPAWCVAGVGGALLFLKLVAHEVEWAATELRLFERRKRIASEQCEEADGSKAGSPAGLEPDDRRQVESNRQVKGLVPDTC